MAGLPLPTNPATSLLVLVRCCSGLAGTHSAHSACSASLSMHGDIVIVVVVVNDLRVMGAGWALGLEMGFVHHPTFFSKCRVVPNPPPLPPSTPCPPCPRIVFLSHRYPVPRV